MTLKYIVAEVALEHIFPTMILDTGKKAEGNGHGLFMYCIGGAEENYQDLPNTK
jgi:hypothetical protein